MPKKSILIPGMVAGPLFFVAIYTLAPMVEGYSHVARTVSEIGRQGSPAESWLQVTNVLVAVCLLLFAWGMWAFARSKSIAALPAILIGTYAVALLGLAAFPTPHPLHNLFGLSMMIGYMSPLAVALSWHSLARGLGPVSWLAFVLTVVAVFLNLSPLFFRDLYPLEYYGVVQRSLFLVFYSWCALLALKLLRSQRLVAGA